MKNIKRTVIWRLIIEFLLYPIYNFLWNFILNFNAKILYFLWNVKKNSFFNMGKEDKLLISNDINFTKIANKIFQEANHLKEGAKKKTI